MTETQALMTEKCASFRVAVVQMDPKIGEVAHNRQTIISKIVEAKARGAQLVVFPECALSGYVFESAEESLYATEIVPGPSTEAIEQACRENDIYAIVGLLERDGDTVYNSAFVVGPQGLVKNYRKCHLPYLGIDRFAAKGDELPIIDLPFARIGILICYDIRFPEAARSLTLRGADMIVVPTNWPEGAESSPEFLTRARCWENRVFLAACNRVGTERGVRFIGRSQIIGPDAKFLAEADEESDTMLVADIDPAQARQKRLVVIPGVFELDPVGHRRADIYGSLTV